MDKELELVEHKASILIDALPYIRDFNQKTVVIEYGCAEWLSGVEEQRLMQDIVLLKSVGMRPIVVHATRMGLDKFRENKRIAKLLELCGVKAIGICGVDTETIGLMLDNDYIRSSCQMISTTKANILIQERLHLRLQRRCRRTSWFICQNILESTKTKRKKIFIIRLPSRK